MNEAAKKNYFEEVEIRLRQQELRTLPIIEDERPVEVGSMQICTVTPNSRVKYTPAAATRAERYLIEHQVTGTVWMVKEYMFFDGDSTPV